MTEYRFVFIDSAGSIYRNLVVKCRDDLDALEVANEMHVAPHLQVWDGERIVLRMDGEGQAEGDVVADIYDRILDIDEFGLNETS